MADFYPLLDRAIRGLPDNTREARNALFTRARDVLLAQLRGMDPPISEEDIAHELAALDEVIARVESEQAPVAPSPAQAPSTVPVPANSAANAPAVAAPAKPVQVGEKLPQAPVATTASPIAANTSTSPATGQSPVAPVGAAPEIAARAVPGKPAAELGHTGIRPAVTAGSGPAVVGAGKPAATARPAQPETTGAADEVRLVPPGNGKGKANRHPSGKRNALIGGLIAVALVGVAGVAYWANKVNLPKVQQAETPEVSATDPNNEQKFAQRVDGGQAQQQAGAAQPGQAIAGAQRAILYEETPDSPQTPKVLQGRVTWKLDSENPGQNQPLENVVRADVTIPEAGLDLQITLRRNTDAALPASHLMELTFRKSAGGEGRVIRDVGVPQFKTEENARGVPLAGLPVAVSETVFLVGLSNLPNDIERNVDLIRNRPWIDLPVRYDNGRRAVIALEKGASGDKVIAEAFGNWGAGN